MTLAFNETILSFGLNDEENNFIKKVLPTKNTLLDVIDTPYDIIAKGNIATIINIEKMSKDEIETIFTSLEETLEYENCHLILVGDYKYSKKIEKKATIVKHFNDLKDQLKFLLLKSHKQTKKAYVFSEKISDCISIIKIIKEKRIITTKELSKTLERSPRTIQRYIEALRIAGEFIEYDKSKKGWYLLDNKSSMFNDF